MLLVRGVLRALGQVLFFALVLLLPIGTWDWPRALVFLGTFGALSLISNVGLALLAPASLEARVEKRRVKNQPRADRVVTAFLGLFQLAWFILIPNDVFRWHLLPEPPFWLAAGGFGLCMLGYMLMVAVVAQNPFAAPIVGDQSDHGQVLVDRGLYGMVRHPMYLGILLLLVGLGLWLGSYASLLLLPIVYAPVIGRIMVEEKTLREILPGYSDYLGKVPYRLIPGVW